jgi:glycosyltransferase involved in cell wall biosynthesis
MAPGVVGGDMPKVSIIVPVYNAEGTLRRCVDSILRQDFTDFELLLVDDGSSDSSPTILDSYAEEDHRVRVIHRDNSGVSETRNAAMDLARGTYLQFLDADDWIAPDATRLLVRAMEDNGADMVICDFYRVVGSRTARKGDIDVDRPVTREEYADLMMEAPSDFYYGVVWNKLFKRQIVEEFHIRMDPGISWCEDFIFNMEYVLHTRLIYPLQVPLYYYVKTEGSLVATSASLPGTVRMKLAVIEYYKKFYQAIYDERDYQRRRLDIYRFFLTSAGDGAVLPGPGSTKLGREHTRAYVDPQMRPNPLGRLYLEQKLLDRYLDNVASQYDLDVKDVRLLVYLMYCETAGSTREMADYVGSSPMSVSASLAKLRSRGYVSTNAPTPDDEEDDATADDGYLPTGRPRKVTGATLAPDSGGILKAISDALDDFDAARTRDMDQDETDSLEGLEAKVFDATSSALLR